MQETTIHMPNQTAPVEGEFQIKLARRGLLLAVPAHRSIAEVIIEAGVDVPMSCGQGVCGTCLTKVLQGEPEHCDSYLTSEEQALNDQMLLCCSRSNSALLVLDL